MAIADVAGTINTCFKCGKAFGRKKGNFSVNYGLMYKGVGFLPFCMDCVNELYNAYLDDCDDPGKAVRQMCRKLDIYWNPKVYEAVSKTNTHHTMMTSYISKINGLKTAGKSYDDSLKELGALWRWPEDSIWATPETSAPVEAAPEPETEEPEEEPVDPKIVEFWGTDFERGYYEELERRYKTWTADIKEISKSEEAIYRQICILEVMISRDSAQGKAIDKNVNALNTLLGSLKLKPVQMKNDAVDSILDNMPFGVGIKRYEDRRPIPEPDPELQDVDGIVKYITVWFLGHLCKMLGIKNTYCKMYEDEIAKLHVEHPEFDDDDDEGLFNNIFASPGDGDEE